MGMYAMPERIPSPALVWCMCIIWVATLSACATGPIPAALQMPPGPLPTLHEVRNDPAAHLGQPVRWGGTIAQIENLPSETQLELVSRPLGNTTRPQETDLTEGRFVAILPGFLDPAIYAPGRELTLVGQIEGTLSRTIGTHPYAFVLIRAQAHHLWPEREVLPPYPLHWNPWFYDPWYAPHPFHRPWPYH